MGLLTAASVGGVAQDKPQQPGPQGMPRDTGGERAMGTVASVGVDRIEIKKMDGSAETVLVNDQTHYRQGQQDIQMEDLKPGDRVMIRGEVNSQKELVAVMVRRMTGEETGRFQNSGSGDRVFGLIVSIDNNQLKVHNPRQGDQIVLVNEQTVFTNQGQPIALKDLKVGDRIFAQGKEADGKLTATQVSTGQWQGRGGSRPPQQ